MAKKIFAAVISAVMLMCMAGCSNNYVMTEEDIAVQKSIEGYWYADDSTGYNEYDENGYFLSLTVVEFTSDYKYLLHVCMPGDGQASGYVLTYDPVAYSFEDKMFRVDDDGIASYARVSVSEDGQTLYWITDDKTDRYNRLTEEQAMEMGISPYDPAAWEETEANTEEGSVTEPEAGDVTESETGSVSENTEEGAPVVNSNMNASADIDLSDFNFDRSVTLASENAEIDKTPVLLWESEDGEIAVYGIYLYEKEPYIFIEHDGVMDTFEQAWNTPRRILPIAAYADYDGDGEKELAVSYYVGSGTGVSIEELVIYEKDSEGHFTEHRFEAPEDILNEKLTVEIDEKNTSVNFIFDGKSVTKNYGEDFKYIKNILSKQEEAEFRFGDIISFNLEGDRITLTGSAGLLTMYYAVGITADVEYADGNFTLTNFEIAEEE